MIDLVYEKVKKPILRIGILQVALKWLLLILCLSVCFIPVLEIPLTGTAVLPTSAFDSVKAVFLNTPINKQWVDFGFLETLIGVLMLLPILPFFFDAIVSLVAICDVRFYVDYFYHAHTYRNFRFANKNENLCVNVLIFPAFWAWKLFLPAWSSTISKFVDLGSSGNATSEESLAVALNIKGVVILSAVSILSITTAIILKRLTKKLPRNAKSFS